MRSTRLLFFVTVSMFLAVAGAHGAVVNGQLEVIWGDPLPGSGQSPIRLLRLITAENKVISLQSSDEFLLNPALMSWRGKEVKVTGDYLGASQKAFTLRAVELIGPPSSVLVQGAQPWVSLLCKFSDVMFEPDNLLFFIDLYGNAPGELDNYWREVSYENINMAGSIAIDWVVLPGTQASYFLGANFPDFDLDALFDDCTAAADPFVDFSNGGGGFEGINLMFNDAIGCCAWGGGKSASLDGVNKAWRATWLPPNGYFHQSVIVHEMAHTYGLLHSNNSDNDGDNTDNPWDVMSNASAYAVFHPWYGFLAEHFNVYHKRLLGWISDQERFLVNSFGTFVIAIDHAVVASTTNYRMAEIELPDGSSYTVESRFTIGNYESNLPGTAVIIHHNALGRLEPSWVIDGDSPPADFSDTEGVMWRVGELFNDPANGVSVAVLAQTGTGFMVRITYGFLIFEDSFE